MTGSYDEVAGACKNIRNFCEDSKVSKDICDKIEICLTEALNNVIKHSYKGESDKEIEIKVRKKRKIFEIDILDSGEARSCFEKPKLEFDPKDIENLPESGMGLFIIEEIMDETHYRIQDGKNIFTMRKFIL
ncbi:MAG: hypothetical protein A2V66_17020 [Ignavibacteria bacterium RBG_13_36_8]|nr:MAG: hypothetical protein A2V66_17020 [Ignavibacteria bacterium RBG_13_36_8]